MGLSQDEKEEIVAKLKGKIEPLKCPVCGHQDFVLVDGYTRRTLSDRIDQIMISGISVPSISIICNNCGYILDFAMGTLGLRRREDGDDENGKTDKNDRK